MMPLRMTTPEGDDIVFTTARYRHSAPDEIRRILQRTDDFGLDDEAEPGPDGAYDFSWYETGPDASASPAPLGRRVLASLTLTPKELTIETPSRRRMNECRRRLKQLLKNRIRLIEMSTKSMEQALEEYEPDTEPEEPLMPPPDVIAEINEKMVRQWIDESIPALDGLTPREAVKTEEGRQKVLHLIDYIVQMQENTEQPPGMFTPDYRMAKEMLGLE